MNKYIELERVEFPVTNACTGRCRHCSIGDVSKEKKLFIDKDKATEALKSLAKLYKIESVMTFGGEPLLYPDTVCAIHKTAAELNIKKRQLITNGYFSRDEKEIKKVAVNIKESGANSILLSVDAFHEEFIPLENVYPFASAMSALYTEGLRLHPAWVVNREADNKYNRETEKCLEYFHALNIPVSKGNNIFPSGNAAKYLSDFYKKAPLDLSSPCGISPYTESLANVRFLSVNPNGDVIVCCFPIGNIYKSDIDSIIESYDPYKDRYTSALISGGVGALIREAEKDGISVDINKHYSACGICREIMKKRKN